MSRNTTMKNLVTDHRKYVGFNPPEKIEPAEKKRLYNVAKRKRQKLAGTRSKQQTRHRLVKKKRKEKAKRKSETLGS